MSTAGLLLTGGSSRRLGVDKATLVLDGETLAHRAARLLEARCERVLEVGPGVTHLAAVREDPPGSGPLAGLVTGAAALTATGAVTSIVLLACDLPWIGPALDALFDPAAADALAAVVLPVDGQGRRQYVCARYGPSALLRANELVASGVHSLRALVDALPAESVVALDGFAPRVFADIDHPADARRAGIPLH